jgi:hypothetical protein
VLPFADPSTCVQQNKSRLGGRIRTDSNWSLTDRSDDRTPDGNVPWGGVRSTGPCPQQLVVPLGGALELVGALSAYAADLGILTPVTSPERVDTTIAELRAQEFAISRADSVPASVRLARLARLAPVRTGPWLP